MMMMTDYDDRNSERATNVDNSRVGHRMQEQFVDRGVEDCKSLDPNASGEQRNDVDIMQLNPERNGIKYY